MAAGRRQRKKAVVQRAIAMPYIRLFGGFEQIKVAVFLCAAQEMAAHGGRRHVLT